MKLQFKTFGPIYFKFLKSKKTNLENFISTISEDSFWTLNDKESPFFWILLMQRYATFYASDQTIESFIRHKTRLESGIANEGMNLKRGDRSRLLLASKAAKLEGLLTPLIVYIQNRLAWNTSAGSRKHPRILKQIKEPV